VCEAQARAPGVWIYRGMGGGRRVTSPLMACVRARGFDHVLNSGGSWGRWGDWASHARPACLMKQGDEAVYLPLITSI
jgi:hypothetical protein